MKLLKMFGVAREQGVRRTSTVVREHARRSCFRMPCLFSFEMRVIGKGTVATAVCSNLSGTGMRMNTSNKLTAESQLECWLPTFTSPIVTFASIVRIEEGRGSAVDSFGLRFEHASEEDEDRLFGHVLDLQRAQIRRERFYRGKVLRPAPAIHRHEEVEALRGLVSLPAPGKKSAVG